MGPCVANAAPAGALNIGNADAIKPIASAVAARRRILRTVPQLFIARSPRAISAALMTTVVAVFVVAVFVVAVFVVAVFVVAV
jgi:hypothetical protein